VNVLDAAHRTVHAYPGGSESLGPRVGISPAVLRSKVNPNTSTHRLAIEEADEIMGVTGDFQILQALAAEHGFGLVRLDERLPLGTITKQVLALNVSAGELSKAISTALDDGVISHNEMQAITSAGQAQQAVLINLISRLSAAADDQRKAAA
jgi:hypothetical protein